MRTTLDIDDDVLCAAKELAAKEKKTAGKILSEIFRRALNDPSTGHRRSRTATGYRLKNNVPVVESRGEIVTTAHIEKLMEDEGV